MALIEWEISRNGIIVAHTSVPEEPGTYSIGDSPLEIPKIILAKVKGQKAIKALYAGIGPPFSDGRIQRFTFAGRPSASVSPETENTLAGGVHRARARITKAEI